MDKKSEEIEEKIIEDIEELIKDNIKKEEENDND